MSGQTLTSNHNVKSGKGKIGPVDLAVFSSELPFIFSASFEPWGSSMSGPAKPVDEETVAGVEQDRRGFDLAAEQARRRQWRLSIENASKFEREITLPK
jgi:hypothetical protein